MILSCVANLKGIDFYICQLSIVVLYAYFCYLCSSVDELRKLLSDKDAYQQFLHSLDQVTIQNNVSQKHEVHLS